MKKFISDLSDASRAPLRGVLGGLLLLALASCGKEDDFVLPTPGGNETEKPEQPGEDPAPTTKIYDEAYRPQVHYTPARNWINDPNGMVFVPSPNGGGQEGAGTWHLFYQYNPQGNGWGNMSWGHATSTDLMHWKEQSVALVKDKLGDIFSGSCVIDKENTSGFGKNAMVAFFTSAGEHQQQSMAYSTDGGNTFTKFSGNPIIANNDMPDFRDPKVFWDDENHQWVMSLARGWTFGIDFYTSPDLKKWTKSGSFSTPDVKGCNIGQWECPDLVKLKVKSEESGVDTGVEKHVLIVSVNPGGPNGGSGTFYFTGDWDGKTFIADQFTDTDGTTPLWFDWGCDNYAGVTWSNAPEGRSIFIGWMNNWMYSGDVPCSPWRSAMTLPRELCLVNTPDGLRLSQSVVNELDGIAGRWSDVAAGAAFPEADAYHVQVSVDISKNTIVTLSNGTNELELNFHAGMGALNVKRQKASGKTDFNGSFGAPSIRAYYGPTLRQAKGEVTFDIYVDRSSVEIVSADGTLASTNLFFPESIYNSISVPARVRPLTNVWR